MDQHPPLAVEVSDLSKAFGHLQAVKKLSLCIKKGTIFGFLGPNGSGKTTSFRMLCGLIAPDSGQGQCLGLDLLKSRKAIQAQIGYMPQKFSLYRNLTVVENLKFFSRIYGVGHERTRIDEIIELFDLGERRTQLAGTLSGGWQQRLSLASALLHQPKMLMLDEPTSGIDPHSRIMIWHYIQRLANQGVTVLLSTHHMDEAERCHELLYMGMGEVLMQGSVLSLINNAHLFTFRISGENLGQIISVLEQGLCEGLVIEKGFEIRVISKTPDLYQWLTQHLPKGYQIAPVETTLEDLFLHKIQMGRPS